MLVNKKYQINNFKFYALPSARKLFERYGFSLAKVSHPDGTDPDAFSAPVNVRGNNLEKIQNAKRNLEFAASSNSASIAAAERAAAEEATAAAAAAAAAPAE